MESPVLGRNLVHGGFTVHSQLAVCVNMPCELQIYLVGLKDSGSEYLRLLCLLLKRVQAFQVVKAQPTLW